MGNMYIDGKVLKHDAEMAMEWLTSAYVSKDPELRMKANRSIQYLFTEFRDEMHRLHIATNGGENGKYKFQHDKRLKDTIKDIDMALSKMK